MNYVQLLKSQLVSKSGDTVQEFEFRLNDRLKKPIDLTGLNVKLLIANRKQLILSRSADIINAANGIVGFTLTEDEKLPPDLYDLEFKVTHSNGKIETFPDDRYIRFKILGTLVDKFYNTNVRNEFIELVEEMKELIAGGGGSGSTVTDSSVNGNILVDGSEIVVFDSTALSSAINGKAAVSHTHAQSEVIGLSTSLAGKANITHIHEVGDVTGLQGLLDGKATTSHTHTIANVTNLQSTLNGKAASSHSHTIDNITGLQTALDAKSVVADSTVNGNILVNGTEVKVFDDTSVVKKVNGNLPDENGNVVISVSGGSGGTSVVSDSTVNGNILIDGAEVTIFDPATLNTAIAGKANATHTHAQGDITGLTTALSGKANTSHTHAIADVTNLQTTLDAKSVVVDSSTNGNILVNGVEVVVYAHPSNHPASIITQDASNRFVTDTEKTTWNGKAPTTAVTTSANGLMISTDKSKLDGIAAGANNYVHPTNHPASIITQDASNRFVTDTEKSTWNGKSVVVDSTVNGNILVNGAEVQVYNDANVVKTVNNQSPVNGNVTVAAGTQGPQGPATYTWVKYATDANGTGINDSPNGMTHIGFAFNKLTETKSTNPADYQWALFQGTGSAQPEPDQIVPVTKDLELADITVKTGKGTPTVNTTTKSLSLTNPISPEIFLPAFLPEDAYEFQFTLSGSGRIETWIVLGGTHEKFTCLSITNNNAADQMNVSEVTNATQYIKVPFSPLQPNLALGTVMKVKYTGNFVYEIYANGVLHTTLDLKLSKYAQMTSALTVNQRLGFMHVNGYPLEQATNISWTKNTVVSGGGGGGVTPAPTNPINTVWNVLGDSISTLDYTTNAYYQYVNQALGFSAVNTYGKSGSRITYTSDGFSMVTRYSAMAAGAGYVTVFGGVNDYFNNSPIGVMADRVNTTFYGALHLLIQGLYNKYPSAKLGFFTPLKAINGSMTGWSANTAGKTLTDYVNAIKEVCAYYAVPVLDLYTVANLTPEIANQKTTYIPDGIHPNAAGHQVKLTPKINNFLRSL